MPFHRLVNFCSEYPCYKKVIISVGHLKLEEMSGTFVSSNGIRARTFRLIFNMSERIKKYLNEHRAFSLIFDAVKGEKKQLLLHLKHYSNEHTG